MAGYVKITFEDIEIAKNFFENEKHLDEFLVNVCKYYCGFENSFKYKNVKKYFETYKKTMDRVILGRSTGSIGGKKRVENQQDISDTLEGVLEGGVKDPVQPKVIKERKLTKETKIKKESESELALPLVSDFISYFEENGYNDTLAKKAFNYYNDNNWKDSQGVQVKSWKNKVRNNWFKDDFKIKPESEKKEYIIYNDQVNPAERKILADKFEESKLYMIGGGYILKEIRRVWE